MHSSPVEQARPSACVSTVPVFPHHSGHFPRGQILERKDNSIVTENGEREKGHNPKGARAPVG